MRNAFVLSLMLLIGACAGPPEHTQTPQPPAAHIRFAGHAGPTSKASAQLDTAGEQALQHLQRWYHNTAVDCGGIDRPSYLCSGVWLRLTTTNLNYLPWDPSPGAITKGGISFAWLRRDQTFTNVLVEARNGLLFYPNDEAPGGKIPLEVLCTFPRDANTWERDTLQGCGPTRSQPEVSGPCLDMGVMTAEQWIERYGGNTSVCGWNLRPEAGTLGRWFNASVQAHQNAPDLVWRTNNELVVSTWQAGLGATLPLVALVYLGGGDGELESRTKAWIDQRRFSQEYGRALPIIRLDLPQSRDQPVTFAYSATDQGLDPTHEVLRADFEDVAIGSYRRVISRGVEFMLTTPSGQVGNEPLPTSPLKGHYASANSTLSFGVKASGPAKVTFDWGCNEYCFVGQTMGEKWQELSDGATPGQMRFGTYSMIVQGPEHITVGSLGEPDTRIVMDNVVIEPQTDAARR